MDCANAMVANDCWTQELLHRRDSGQAVSVAEMKAAIEAAMQAGMCAETSKIYFDAGHDRCDKLWT